MQKLTVGQPHTAHGHVHPHAHDVALSPLAPESCSSYSRHAVLCARQPQAGAHAHADYKLKHAKQPKLCARITNSLKRNIN